MWVSSARTARGPCRPDRHAVGERENGSLTVVVAAIVVASSLGIIAAFRAAGNCAPALESLRARTAEEESLAYTAERVVRALRDDATPQADSRHDRVWRFVESFSASGIPVGLADLSSNGGDFSYLNVNTAPLGLIREVIANRGVVQCDGGSLLSELRRRRERGTAIGPNALEVLLGASTKRLVPPLCAEPIVNVNLAAQSSLRRSLAKGIAAPRNRTVLGSRPGARLDTLTARIVQRRNREEIDAGELGRLLALELGDGVALPDLGVRTWCWRIRVAGHSHRYTCIQARMLGDNNGELRTIGAFIGDLPADPAPISSSSNGSSRGGSM